jgi:preprotein translocase subunit SecE
MESIILYIKESYNELMHNVTWPTWAELFAASRLVLFASALIALVIFLMDLVSKNVLTTIYDLL